MTVQGLVVRPGDRVTLAGRFVRGVDADWLDLARAAPLAGHFGARAPRMSRHSVPVVGVDAELVPKDFGPQDAIMAGQVRVWGVWQDGVVAVERQDVVERAGHRGPSELACPAPPQGWDTRSRSMTVRELDELRASGAIVADDWIELPDGAVVLRVAAADLDQVRRVLDPRLPRRLCAVASRFSKADVGAVEEALANPRPEWLILGGSGIGISDTGQPFLTVRLLRVSDEFADWADTVPEGLLDLDAKLIPA